jgi:AraC family transcriptional regulator of arabinose operon
MRISAGYTPHEEPTTFARAKGFPYWTIGVLICGRFDFGVPQAAPFSIGGPSLVCIRPNTPYRLAVRGGAGWAEYFMIFTPRADWLAWLNWPPTLAAGVTHLRLESHSHRRVVLRAAHEVHESFASSQPESESFAYNAMERFLLLAHTINPIASPMRTDARIAAALEHIGQHLATPLTVEMIAQQVGMSVSHLAHRFREQIGQSPMRYIEAT